MAGTSVAGEILSELEKVSENLGRVSYSSVLNPKKNNSQTERKDYQDVELLHSGDGELYNFYIN